MWYNPLIVLLLRSPLHRIASKSILVITYKGHKTGKRYRVPVSFVCDDADYLVVTFRRRTWWRSLKAGSPPLITIRGRDFPAEATVVDDPEEVRRDLALYLNELRYLAKHLGVAFDEEGQPDPEALEEAAEKRIMVRLRKAS